MLKRYQECQQKLQRYKQVLGEGIQCEHPNKLKRVQQVFHHRDEDIAHNEAQIPALSEPTKIFQSQPLCYSENGLPAKLPVKTGVTSRAKIPCFSNIQVPRVSDISVNSVLRHSTLLMGASVFIIGILSCGATLQPRHPVDARPNVRPTASSLPQMSAEAFYFIGVNKYVNADYKGAIENFNQALQLDPNYADAYYHRGNAKGKLGDYQGAISDYNQVIKLDPNNAIAYNNRGHAKSALGDKKGAISDYNQAAELYQKLGQTKKYQDALEKAKKLQ